MAALGFAAAQLWQTAAFLGSASRTEGIIADGAPHPAVRFTTQDGKAVTFLQNGFVSRPFGASVPVAYLPQDPAGTARVVTFWTTWGIAGWMLPFGIAAGLLPVFGLLLGWWKG